MAGNIIGGSFIFALISHAQIRSEKDTTAKLERDRQDKAEKSRREKQQQTLKDADISMQNDI
ncbi:hypothetical protein ALQ20_200022 [Pseudomonas syringae pv. atrofaciens]|nr:hypothetical protein ALQ20_200022 [Pseudomonas syringae pv. atrofaciens]